MKTMLDYVLEYGQYDFDDKPFNDIDSLVLTQMIYLNYSSCIFLNETTLGDIINIYFHGKNPKRMKLGVILPRKILDIAYVIKDSKRYKDLLVSDYLYVLKNDIQFCAMTIKIQDGISYLCLQGTDDTTAGWYEDLIGAFYFPYSSQSFALDYVKNAITNNPNDKFYIGGHSKGGNLTSYSYLYLSDLEKESIIKAYDFDGQGFPIKDGNYSGLDKLYKFRPYDSIIGRLMYSYYGHDVIIKTTKKGVYAHDGTSWCIEEDHFALAHKLNPKRTALVNNMTEFVSNFDESKKEAFVKDIGLYLASLKGKTLLEIRRHPVDDLIKYRMMSKDSRDIVRQLFKMFVKNYYTFLS